MNDTRRFTLFMALLLAGLLAAPAAGAATISVNTAKKKSKREH